MLHWPSQEPALFRYSSEEACWPPVLVPGSQPGGRGGGEGAGISATRRCGLRRDSRKRQASGGVSGMTQRWEPLPHITECQRLCSGLGPTSKAPDGSRVTCLGSKWSNLTFLGYVPLQRSLLPLLVTSGSMSPPNRPGGPVPPRKIRNSSSWHEGTRSEPLVSRDKTHT